MKNINIRFNAKENNAISDLDPKSLSGYTERWAQILLGIRKMTFVSLSGFVLEQQVGKNQGELHSTDTIIGLCD